MRGEAEDLAEASFRKAIEIARHQQAKSWELRATTSLSRLLQKQGRKDEARSMLCEIYSWFTGGFDTADLKDAGALLDSLSKYGPIPYMCWPRPVSEWAREDGNEGNRIQRKPSKKRKHCHPRTRRPQRCQEPRSGRADGEPA